MRKFALLEPSVADPAGLIVAMDISDPEHVIAYNTLDSVIAVIEKMKHDQAFRDGQNHESIRAQKYLEELGWSVEQIRAFLFWRAQ